ncbi:DUF3046 domain-containing protein [Catelliglobosispora koreensis]|uniref:DUF3046 domain-containing protein n=1 Tax=Catelliglobosispora koreensis TaxID=129052 RepID=UPI00036B0531|nr:DUF3046 domain-containing protein [Catelliglobosispora koreensis]
MRQTDFWERMNTVFGQAYASSVATDQVISQLGDRTIKAALADGVDVHTVWRAVCSQYADRVPARLR